MHLRLLLLTLGAGITFGAPRVAHAQVDARVLVQTLGVERSPTSGGRVPVVVRLPAGTTARAQGAIDVSPGFGVAWLAPEALASFAPGAALGWAPPRRTFLDRADGWVHAGVYRNVTGQTGRGVVVGIVDTGVDPSHGDLRDAEGHSRIAWLLDVSRGPAGLHPDLEAEYGCGGETGYRCAIYSAADLDRLIADHVAGTLPTDSFGHGTHVASIAAGNGLSSPMPRYVGVAPEATIIAARVARGNDGSIYDPDVLLATRFVFDRAADLSAPAVVNLSLGSDFGPHDGRTDLEEGLAAFIGPEHPGRAIVAAAGNEAGVFGASVAPGYPAPFGIHTEVHVPHGTSTRVPLIVPATSRTTKGSLYVYIASRPGDALSVGFETADETIARPLDPGETGKFDEEDLEVSILNDAGTLGGRPLAGSHAAIVLVRGSWPGEKVLLLRLEGHGTAQLWVQSEGELTGGGGGLFPRAIKQGTIAIPGSHPEIIAVGATLNRKRWTDRHGDTYSIPRLGGIDDPPEDTVAYFSGAGPTSNGELKPDVSAPGALVAAAMTPRLDPALTGGQGMFASSSCASESGSAPRTDCMVVDDTHALASGTSMAAPFVSGAVALLFARDPGLTQRGVRALLQAGARWPTGVVTVEQQVGAGSIDLSRTLEALDDAAGPLVPPDAQRSWMALSQDFAHPDPTWPVEGYVELRGAEGQLSDGLDTDRVALSVRSGDVTEPLHRVAPGFWRFAAVARAGTGGGELTLTLSIDGAVFLRRALPIAVDPSVVDGGGELRGGCNLAPASDAGTALGIGVLGLALLARRHRRAR